MGMRFRLGQKVGLRFQFIVENKLGSYVKELIIFFLFCFGGSVVEYNETLNLKCIYLLIDWFMCRKKFKVSGKKGQKGLLGNRKST